MDRARPSAARRPDDAAEGATKGADEQAEPESGDPPHERGTVPHNPFRCRDCDESGLKLWAHFWLVLRLPSSENPVTLRQLVTFPGRGDTPLSPPGGESRY